MNENKNPLDFIVRTVNYVIDVLARVMVDLFDGIKNAVDHASPSLFALIAVLLPYAIPLPVALMTAISAQKFFGWGVRESYILGFGLEGLGLLVWVKLADSIVIGVSSANEKIENYITFLWGSAITYEILLVSINVILALREGADFIYALTLLLVCLLPALSAVMYGLHKREVIAQLTTEQSKAEALAEKIRQERRADRKEAQAMKMKYAADADGVSLEEKPKGDKFRKP